MCIASPVEGFLPSTGEAMHIAASNVPGFKAGKALKDAVKAGNPA